MLELFNVFNSQHAREVHVDNRLKFASTHTDDASLSCSGIFIGDPMMTHIMCDHDMLFMTHIFSTQLFLKRHSSYSAIVTISPCRSLNFLLNYKEKFE